MIDESTAKRRATSRGGSRQTRAATILGGIYFGLAITAVAAEATDSSKPERNVDGIMDNSFLVEEAYNQEANVVQHILAVQYAHDAQPGSDDQLWNMTFTQEWPLFSQKHQLSYTIPYNYLRTGGSSEHGFGDVLLNYRYQAYFNEANLMAFAPRASLVLPTGDEDLGFGEGKVGAQFNLPFSVALNDKWFVHLNAGITFLPEAYSAQNRDLLHYNVGASTIYAMTRDFHLMLEWVGYWIESGDAGLPKDHRFTSLISPGFRKAFNFSNGAQLVVGLAAPIGLNNESPDYGAFIYASFEHFLKKP